jgi:hypothetical protein
VTRGTLARRYAPLVALAAIQLLIIATVPSKAPNKASAAQQQVAAGSAAGGGSASVVTGQAGGTASTVAGTGGALGGAAGGATTGAGGSAGSGGAAGNATGAVSGAGDVSHCVSGREFDPNIAYYAPACVPGTPGGPFPNNGGATASGVTGDTITLIDYTGNPGAEVDAIEQAEGLYRSFQSAKILDAAYQNFINKYFVLYGRKVKIITYQGQCTTVPPDTNCLLPEMDKIASQYHPYILEWGINTVCSACYAELARDGVITTGGVGFSDAFAQANAPYFYAVSQSSTRIEEQFADFYCKQMAKYPVQYAGHGNPAQPLNGKPRVLGVISTNDPDNKSTVKNVLYPALAKCGVSVTHEYFYAQDINTAAQQVAAGIAAMDTPTNPATVVLCLCDAVAPAFLYEGEDANRYYPENVIATDQGMDLDKAAQSYESGLGCPSKNPCEFDNAFGLSPNGPEQPSTNNEGTRIYAAGGGTNLPVDPTANAVYAEDFVMAASLIQNTGPDLTPANMYAKAPSAPALGGGATNQALLHFTSGVGGWQQDVRVVYWDKHKASSYNGQPGTFVQIEGGRYDLGQLPTGQCCPGIPQRS